MVYVIEILLDINLYDINYTVNQADKSNFPAHLKPNCDAFNLDGLNNLLSIYTVCCVINNHTAMTVRIFAKCLISYPYFFCLLFYYCHL